jgi:hypothetical protein
LIKLFQKFAGSKGSALGRARRRETPQIRRFWFFLRQFCQKERRELSQCKRKGSYWRKVTSFFIYVSKLFPYFSLTMLAQRKVPLFASK